MKVTGNTAPRRLAEIDPDIDPFQLVGFAEHGFRALGQKRDLVQLIDGEIDERRQVPVGQHQEMTVVVGIPVEDDVSERAFEDDQRIALVLDHNGNGKRDAYTEPNEPADPMKDRRLNVQYYGDSPAYDGSIWGSVQGMPGAVVRLVPGAHPPETALAEIYEVPWNNPKAATQGFAPRGMDVDSNNVVWTVLSSGHLASFDRRKCKGPLNGPTATGQHCPEGWTLYPLPGPNYKGATDNASAESAYYDFVDRFDMLGVGKDVPIATGNLSESLLALVDGRFLTLRVPYPLGFFAKGMDGRIDDPKGGWKGKGIFTTWATRAPFHAEGGKGTTSKLVKFQMRPDPLSK